MKYFFSISFCVLTRLCFAQSYDTAFYGHKKILMITMNYNEKDSVVKLNDLNGNNILKHADLTHTFYDTKFNKKRTIKIANYMLIEDYCVSESDTIYNYLQHDENYTARLRQFYNYLEQNVVYPKNALKKGVQAQVKISFIIDLNGAITQVFPCTKNDWGFEESVIRAITDKKQYGFIIYHNKPIKLYLEIPFAFVIKKN